jgi:hypothetical protein
MSFSLNEIIFSDLKLSLFETSIIKTLNNFYNDSINIELIEKLLFIKSKLSIRLIDYFITKYSKINKCSYYIDNSLFNIFISYKQQLKIFQKKYFDPFSRGNRIPFFFWKNNSDNFEKSYTSIITTIGQLNFFKWFIEKKIYEFILNNYDNIEISMNIHNKEVKENKKFNNKSIKKKINANLIKNIVIQNNQNLDNNFRLIEVSFNF